MVTTGARFKWTLNQLFDARWGARYIPPFDNNRPSFTPTKNAFLLQRVIESIFLYSLIWLTKHYPLNTVSEDFHHAGFLHRIQDVDAREITVRVYISFTAVAIPGCALRLIHGLASILAILCGDVPARWPPLFGSLKDAYTVRRFWS